MRASIKSLLTQPDQLEKRSRHQKSEELRCGTRFLLQKFISELPFSRIFMGVVGSVLSAEDRIGLFELVGKHVELDEAVEERIASQIVDGKKLTLAVADEILDESGVSESAFSQGDRSEFIRTVRTWFLRRVRGFGAREASLRPLTRRAELLKDLFGLTAVEARVFAYVYAYEKSRMGGMLEGVSKAAYESAAATVLDLDDKHVRNAIRPTSSRLISFGLVSGDNFDDPVYLSTSAGENFMDGTTDPSSLESSVRKDTGSTYRLESFPITDRDQTILVALLKSATHGSILFHGVPGAGKTELARSAARRAGRKAFFVTFPEEKSDSDSPSIRMAILRQASRIACASDGVLIIDEADSVINTQSLFGDSGKGPLVDLIESLPITIIWITNESDGVHSAVSRRLLHSIRFAEADLTVREARLRRELKRVQRTLSADEVRDFAETYQVSLGSLSKAIQTANLVAAETGEDAYRHTLEQLLSSEHELVHAKKPVRKSRTRRLNGSHALDRYRAEYVHASADPAELQRVIEQYVADREAGAIGPLNILFHGVSGSGKTAFVQYIAQAVGLELHQHAASSLLRPFVGQTEVLIHEMFAAGTQKEAIVFLDEAENLLQDRGSAHQGHERQVVNEFLSQMEQHNTIFICATNERSIMDVATQRRFTFKIEFFALKEEARVAAYREYFTYPHIRLTPALQQRVRKLTDLKLGTLRSVSDQFRFTPCEEITHQAIIETLEAELDLTRPKTITRVRGFQM